MQFLCVQNTEAHLVPQLRCFDQGWEGIAKRAEKRQDPNMTMPQQTQARGQGCLVPFLLLGILGVLCMGGCGALAYFTIHEVNEQAEAALGNNQVIMKHIGLIKEMDPNYAEFDKQYDLSYMVEGVKGYGKVQMNTSESSDSLIITSGTLTTSDGDTYQLIPRSK